MAEIGSQEKTWEKTHKRGSSPEKLHVANGNVKLTNNHNQIAIYDKLFFNDVIYDKRKSLTQ